MKKTIALGIVMVGLARITGAQEAASAVGFSVADARAEGDKKQKILSLSITSCSYAIQRLGEKKAPGRIDALREDLAHAKGIALEGKKLEVSTYNIFFNNKAVLKGMVYAPHGGLVSDVMKEMGEECPREKMKGGWFDVTELQNPYSPLVVELEASLDGQAYPVRVVHAPAFELAGNFARPVDAAEVRAVMRMTADALAAKLP